MGFYFLTGVAAGCPVAAAIIVRSSSGSLLDARQ
jgi:hypothetical protein